MNRIVGSVVYCNLESLGEAAEASEDHREKISLLQACVVSNKLSSFSLNTSPDKTAGRSGLSGTWLPCVLSAQLGLSPGEQPSRARAGPSRPLRGLSYDDLEKMSPSPSLLSSIFFLHTLYSCFIYLCQFVYIAGSKSFRGKAWVLLVCVVPAVSLHSAPGKAPVVLETELN